MLLFLLESVPAIAKPLPLATEILGQGPVAVFESGLGKGRDDWREVANGLAPCLTVVLYDRRGVGASPAPPDPAVPVLAAAVADDLLGALHDRGLPGPYVLIGHSLGGLYVQAFARNHPNAIAGLVLVDAASPLEPPGVFVPKLPPKPGSVEASEEAGVAPSVEALLAGPPLPPVPLMVLVAAHHDMSPKLEAVWREVQTRTAALSPKGKFVVLESGHFIQNDRPESVIDAVLSIAAETGADVGACAR